MNRLIRFLDSCCNYGHDLLLFLFEILKDWLKLLFTVSVLLTIPYLSYVLYDMVSSDLTFAGRALSHFVAIINDNQGVFALLIVMLGYLTYFKVQDIRVKQNLRIMQGDSITGTLRFISRESIEREREEKEEKERLRLMTPKDIWWTANRSDEVERKLVKDTLECKRQIDNKFRKEVYERMVRSR